MNRTCLYWVVYELRVDVALQLQDIIPTSLLKLSSENSSRAVKMFLGIQKFTAEGPEAMPTIMRYEMAQKLLHQVSPSVLGLSQCHSLARAPLHLVNFPSSSVEVLA